MAHTAKQQLGENGERLACRFLEQKGHRILKRGFRSGRAELDIISAIEDTIVISEVKSYHSDPLGVPEYRVNKRQQKNIIRGAYTFLDRHPRYEGMGVRFDVIIVDFSEYPAKITHHEGAFWDEAGW